ncbi:MAG: hypothetical protein IJR89_03495 [Clostridia bacterium]|nr:hypothetical protein [Clostridia bacterium]
MCSIFGYCGAVSDRAAFEIGFAETKSRGPDDSRVERTGEGLLAFHRLSIMGLTPSGMQPFSLNGCFAVWVNYTFKCNSLEKKSSSCESLVE